MTKLSPSVVTLIGESNLSEVSHATVELKLTGTSAEVQRAVKHIAGKKGRAKLAKLATKEVVDEQPDEPEDAPEESESKEESSPRTFANKLLDS